MLEWLTFKNSKNSKLKGLRKREGERERERGGSGRRVGGEQSDKGEKGEREGERKKERDLSGQAVIVLRLMPDC